MTHGLKLHPQQVIGEFQRPGDGLQVVNQHAENNKTMMNHTDNCSLGGLHDKQSKRFYHGLSLFIFLR